MVLAHVIDCHRILSYFLFVYFISFFLFSSDFVSLASADDVDCAFANTIGNTLDVVLIKLFINLNFKAIVVLIVLPVAVLKVVFHFEKMAFGESKCSIFDEIFSDAITLFRNEVSKQTNIPSD